MTPSDGPQAPEPPTAPPAGPPPGASSPYPSPYPPGYPPPPGYVQGWVPQPPPTPPRGPILPRWLDFGLILIGVGALLTFFGFIFGAAAISSYGPSGGTYATYQGWYEGFFVVTGLGILLMVGGWLFRTVMGLRKANP